MLTQTLNMCPVRMMKKQWMVSMGSVAYSMITLGGKHEFSGSDVLRLTSPQYFVAFLPIPQFLLVHCVSLFLSPVRCTPPLTRIQSTAFL